MVSSIPLSGSRELDFSKKPLIMGIINCTPDSFYPESRMKTLDAAIGTAERMIQHGADILDIGGESSRPGSDFVPAEEEMQRILPVIEGVRAFSDIPVSVDTRKRETAEAAVHAGADLVNDISALRDDPELGVYLGKEDLPVVLMHMKGSPKTMQDDPYYDDVLREISQELEEAVRRAAGFGIAEKSIIIDPGIGFGKRVEDNLTIIKGIPKLKEMDYPLLIGLSRKAFIGTVLGNGAVLPVEERLNGTIAAHTYAALKGADILRVHDVRETFEAVTMVRAIEGIRGQR